MLRAPVELRGAVNSMKLIPVTYGREELLAAEHALQLVAPSARRAARSRVGRVARDLLDPEVAFGDARDLRQVRDREDLCAPGEPLQRLPDRVRRARRRCPRRSRRRPASRRRRPPRSRARSGRARRRTRSRRPARTAGPRFGRIRKATVVGPVGPGSARASSTPELALAEADALELARQPPPRTARPPARSRCAELCREALDPLLGSASASAAAAGRIGAVLEGSSSAFASAARAAAPRRSAQRKRRFASAIRSSSASTCSSRPGSASSEARKAAGRTRTRAAAARRRAGRRRPLELGREPLDRRQAARRRDEPAAPSPSSGASASPAAAAASASSVDVAQALALGAEPSRVSGSRPSVSSTSARSSASRPPRRPRLGQLFVAPPRGREARARRARSSARRCLLLAGEGVEHVELVRGPGEPALLELAGHRDQPLGRGGDVLAAALRPHA